MTDQLPSTPRFLEMKSQRADYGPQLEILVAYIYNHVVRPGSFVVDGGANAGLHAGPLTRLVAPGGHVVCFEPAPRSVAALRRNLAAAIEAGIAEARQQALGHAAGTMQFTVNTRNSALSRLAVAGDVLKDDQERIDVEVVTLDDVLPHQAVDFIKLDLEGYDFNGIRGARKVVARGRPPIVFENGRGGAAWRYGYTEEDFHAWFAEMGYLVFDLHNVPLTSATWQDRDVGFEFIAIHRDDPRRATIHQAIHHFWATAADRAVLTEWRECVRTCRDPVRYVGCRFDGLQVS